MALQRKRRALSGVAQLERHPVNQMVAGLNPGWGAYKKAANQCFCVCVCVCVPLLLSFFPSLPQPLPLKPIKKKKKVLR